MDSMGRNEDSYSGWAVSVLEVRNTGSANQRRGRADARHVRPLLWIQPGVNVHQTAA